MLKSTEGRFTTRSGVNILTPSGEVIGRMTTGGTASYYLKDHLGSVRAVVNASGTVLETRDYYPFGMEMPGRSYLSGTKAKENFTGYELDDESGLHYAGARYYMPNIGRFTSTDRFKEKYPGLSPYQYAANNPLRYIDVNGDSINVARLNREQTSLVIRDLMVITGLPLAVNATGNIVVVEGLRGPGGDSSEGASFLISALNDPATVRVGAGSDGSSARSLSISLDFDQIQGFVDNTPSSLDSRTMGFGMTFLHEVNHTALGARYHGSDTILRDPRTGTGTGPVVDHVNLIRSELGLNWGQRAQYLAVPVTDKRSYISFISYRANRSGTGYRTSPARIYFNR